MKSNIIVRTTFIAYFNGNLYHHREDGPAVEYFNGTQTWCIDGRIHRADGPAIINQEGKFWFINGKRHREDGPAIEYNNGSREWWVNGYFLRKDKI